MRTLPDTWPANLLMGGHANPTLRMSQGLLRANTARVARGAWTGADILESLNGEPARNDDGSCAVGWLLSSLAPHECALLITRCGVSPRALARHVRAMSVRNERLARFLNQFAARR